MTDITTSYARLMSGDCLARLKELEDDSIDMVLCDPPYGTTANKWDSVIPLEPLWVELNRVSKKTAAQVMTAAQPFTSDLVVSNRKNFKQSLVWYKNIASNFLNANRAHLQRHEDILLFYRKMPVFNKQLRPGKPYTAKRRGYDDSGDCYNAVNKRIDTVNTGGRNPITVLEFDRETGKHPTQKPVPLFEYLIKTYSDEGDTILDFTMGSGTTGVSAINTGRKFVGIELDQNHYGVAVNRVLEAAGWSE